VTAETPTEHPTVGFARRMTGVQPSAIRELLRLGADLGMSVVAEGVERPEQLAELQAMGFAYVQGYLLSRPVPADEVEPLLSGSLLPVLGSTLPAG